MAVPTPDAPVKRLRDSDDENEVQKKKYVIMPPRKLDFDNEALEEEEEVPTLTRTESKSIIADLDGSVEEEEFSIIKAEGEEELEEGEIPQTQALWEAPPSSSNHTHDAKEELEEGEIPQPTASSSSPKQEELEDGEIPCARTTSFCM